MADAMLLMSWHLHLGIMSSNVDPGMERRGGGNDDDENISNT